MNKLIRVYKKNEVYTFQKNNQQQLILSMEDKTNSENSYIRVVEDHVDEISAFVEDNRNIYLIFKKEENLKCIILQDGVINTGNLYSYATGNYKIYDAHMFIRAGNVNIVAILKNDSPETNDALVHYIYEGETVKKNVLRSLNKKLNYRDYVFDIASQEENIYYLDKMFSKEYVFTRKLNGEVWSEEKKLYEVQGEIQSIDVKKKEDNIYLAIVEKIASIFAIRVLILDREFKILKQKVHYSVFEIKKINIVQQNELYAIWKENNILCITSPLCCVNPIEIFKLDNRAFNVCESYDVEKFSVINKKEVLVKNIEGNIEGNIEVLNIEGILKEILSNDLVHSKLCDNNAELNKNICDNIVTLKESILNHKNGILDKLSSFSLSEHSVENYINELKILNAQKDKLEADKVESIKLLELYEQTIKTNHEEIISKDELITHNKTLLDEQELVIKELNDQLDYEESKGLFKRIFKL